MFQTLENNISISSQYLESLSLRYKDQIANMEQEIKAAITALNDTATLAHEKDLQHEKDLKGMREQINNISEMLHEIIKDKDNLANTVVEQHLLLMVIEVIVLTVVFTLCSQRRSRASHTSANVARSDTDIVGDDHSNCYDSAREIQTGLRVRRRSVDSITRERNAKPRKRRPSEEALNISGEYKTIVKFYKYL